MRVTVVLVGLLRDYAMASSIAVLLCSGATVEDMLRQLAIPSELVAIVLVNGLQRPKGHPLADGDAVKLVPLMGGG